MIAAAGATVTARFQADAPPTKNLARRGKTHNNTMESPHPDERPHKKRRFFTEESSPVVESIQRYSPSPAASPESPHDDAISLDPTPPDGVGAQNGEISDGFDIGLLQAVVGELSPSVLEGLKRRSDNDVQRGMQQFSGHLSYTDCI